MDIKLDRNQSRADRAVQGEEAWQLLAIVPGAIKEFCEKTKIPEELLPDARINDKDFVSFMYRATQGGSSSADTMTVSMFAAAIPKFPRDKIQALFAHVAEAVSTVSKELRGKDR